MGVENRVGVALSLASFEKTETGMVTRFERVILQPLGVAEADEETGRPTAYFLAGMEPRIANAVGDYRVFRSKETGQMEIGIPLDTNSARLVNLLPDSP